MKVALVNDTLDNRPDAHFGCKLVHETYLEQFERVGIELVQTVHWLQKHFSIRDDVDLVVVNGEGSIHHRRRPELVNIANTHPAVLINAVWDSNPPYDALRKFKYVAVRESLSQRAIPVQADVVPDIIFASKRLTSFEKGQPVEDIGVSDNVLNQNRGGDGGFSVLAEPDDYLKELTSYKRLCVGRFHTLIAAAVLGIPCSAWPSNTHKNLGLMTDMGVPQHHYETKKEALENVPTELDPKIPEFVKDSKVRIEQMFDRIAEL